MMYIIDFTIKVSVIFIRFDTIETQIKIHEKIFTC